MKCPCKDCLVYVRCKQRVIKLTQYQLHHKREIRYVFDDLIRECDELKMFFGVNSIFHKVSMASIKSYHFYTLTQYLIKQPQGKKLVEEFLTVMGQYELPTLLNPTIRITSGIKK